MTPTPDRTTASPEAMDPQSEHAALYADHANLLAAVDQLGVTMCLLDERGRVLWVNETRRRFPATDGGNPALCSQGSDYLAQVRALPDTAGTPNLEATLRAVLEGTIDTATFDYACHSPTERRWFQARLRGFRTGSRRRVLVVHEDVTARKLSEEARTEATRLLLRLQSMATLGAFTQGIVHDFNNLLTVMIGNTEIARMQAGTDPNLQELLAAIASACQQARNLTQQLLRRGREPGTSRAPVDVARLVRDVASLLRAAAPATLGIETRIDATSDIVADGSQLHQLLLNLATNARQAMQDRGTLTLQLDVTTEGPIGSRASAERWLRLRVADTGPGIEGAVLPHIFEPFFTTKPVGEGSGLGLAIVQEIARSHGGTVTASSPPGGGATFTVWLPAAGQAAPVPRHGDQAGR